MVQVDAAGTGLGDNETKAMDVDDIQLSKGLTDIFEGGSMSKCEINVSTLFDASGQNLFKDADGFLDLSCLDLLRPVVGKSGTFFMPDRIFIRSEMQKMFSALLKCHPDE